MRRPFPHYKQQDQMDCGATCLRMVCRHYGRNVDIYRLRQLCQMTKGGINLLGISEAAEKIGFRTLGVKLTLEQLSEIQLPCILHWRQNHFVVLYKINKSGFHVADPASGIRILSVKEFKDNWFSRSEMHNGISLLLETTPQFYEREEDDGEKLD